MPTVQLSPAATTILVGSYVLLMAAFVVVLAVIAFALIKANATLAAYQAKIDPLVEQTQTILTLANEKLNSIGDKTEAILSQGENTADVVRDKVEKTATMVQRTVNAPLIGLNALTAGVSRAVRTFGKLQRAPGEFVEVDAETNPPTVVREITVTKNNTETEFGTAVNSRRTRTNV